MSKIKLSKNRLPRILRETCATEENGNKLFSVPTILVFRSEKFVNLYRYGTLTVADTVNIESNIRGYIPPVYGDKAYELDRVVQQLLINPKEINIAGYFNNRVKGRLMGVSVASSSFIDDENGPHTSWIKVIAKSYKVEPVKDKVK